MILTSSNNITDKIRLLVVEDSPSTRLSITMMLGFEPAVELIAAVGTAREALEALKLRPNIILMDMTLPDMDGLSIIHKIRQILPEAALVAMSVEEIFEESALAAGAHTFLAKPFNIDTLLNTLRHNVALSYK